MDKKLKILIISVILIIIVLAIAIIILLSIQKDDEDPEEIGYTSTTEDVSFRDKLTKVTSKYEFFDTKTCIEEYFGTLSKINEDQYTDSELNITSSSIDDYLEIYKENLYSMLDEDYTELFNVELENIDKKFSKYYENLDFEISNMYVLDTENELSIYLVYGKLIYTDENKIVNYGLIVKRDTANLKFSIYPYDYMTQKEYTEDNIDNINLDITIEDELEIKDYNSYSSDVYDDEYVCLYYFNRYKTQLVYDIEDLYNSLDEQYREERFGTLEEYKEYVENYEDDLSNVILSGYAYNELEDYEEYICKDQYDNLYIFKQSGINEYTLTLDTYTLEQEKFTTEYSEATNQEKVLMNIDKFFEMINTKDYAAAYNLLNTEYKNNYFKTQADFEEYIKQKLFKYNEVTYNSFSDKISGIFTYSLTITDKTGNTDENIEMNIAMELLDDLQYTISFEIIE